LKTGHDLSRSGCILEPFLLDANGHYFREEYSRQGLTKEVTTLLLSFVPELIKVLTSAEKIFLLNEQYIIKPANSKQSSFAWHTDSQYLHKPCHYISVWIPLDTVHEGNGTLYVKPFEKPLDKHCWKDPTDKIFVYNSTDPPDDDEEGIPLNMDPGDMLIFSSFLWHRSSPNSSSEMRRVLMPQFSTVHLKYEDADGEQQYERFAVECFDQ